MKTVTPAQQIAALEAKISRLRAKDRALENGQKIIIGGMMIALAQKDQKAAQRLVELCTQNVTRDVDKKRLEPLLKELNSSIDNINNQGNQVK